MKKSPTKKKKKKKNERKEEKMEVWMDNEFRISLGHFVERITKVGGRWGEEKGNMIYCVCVCV